MEAGPIALNPNHDGELLGQITALLQSLSRSEWFANLTGRMFGPS